MPPCDGKMKIEQLLIRLEPHKHDMVVQMAKTNVPLNFLFPFPQNQIAAMNN
jgi:hypothetical protein